MSPSSCAWLLRGVLLGALVRLGVSAQGQSPPPSPPSATAEFSPLPFVMAEDFSDLEMVAWRVEQGQPDSHNPLVAPKFPWDIGGVMGHGTVLHDPIDGRWKAWQISNPVATQPPDRPGVWLADDRLTYLESDDGVNWRRPELSIVKWPGYKGTNILMDPWCSYASVDIDPKREWPYELFIFLRPEHPGSTLTGRVWPMAPGMERNPSGLYRFHSKDGIHWEIVAGPLNLPTSDSCYIFRQGEGYVAYHKTELTAFPGGLVPYDIADGGLRVMARRTSSDGIHWSDPMQLILMPDWRDPADTQFMELNPVAYPGGYVAMVTVFHNHTQNIDLQWAASRDGVHWWRPDRRPALPNGPLGEYGGGMIWPCRAPVLDGRELHVYFGGSQGTHGDLFNTRTSGPRRLTASGDTLSRQSSSFEDYAAFCRATWRVDRLWALAPAGGGPYIGSAVTKPRALGNTELWVNVATHPDGGLRAELLDARGRVLPGFAAADCQPIHGDQEAAVLRWNSASVAPSAAVKVRFLLREAYLYGFDARAPGPAR